MTHDLPTTTIRGKQYVLVETISRSNVCTGCAFDKDKHRSSGGCADLVRGASVACYDRLIYIPNTPKDIADHIAQRLENT
jgi:hypothetical protein